MRAGQIVFHPDLGRGVVVRQESNEGFLVHRFCIRFDRPICESKYFDLTEMQNKQGGLYCVDKELTLVRE